MHTNTHARAVRCRPIYAYDVYVCWRSHNIQIAGRIAFLGTYTVAWWCCKYLRAMPNQIWIFASPPKWYCHRLRLWCSCSCSIFLFSSFFSSFSSPFSDCYKNESKKEEKKILKWNQTTSYQPSENPHIIYFTLLECGKYEKKRIADRRRECGKCDGETGRERERENDEIDENSVRARRVCAVHEDVPSTFLYTHFVYYALFSSVHFIFRFFFTFLLLSFSVLLVAHGARQAFCQSWVPCVLCIQYTPTCTQSINVSIESRAMYKYVSCRHH